MSQEKLQHPFEDSPLSLCVPSLPFNNNNRRSPNGSSSHECASEASVAAMTLRMCQEEVVVLLLLLCISHTPLQPLNAFSCCMLKLNLSCNMFPLLTGNITHCSNYPETLLSEQLCMWECGKTVGVETLKRPWVNTEGWQSAVADADVP